MNYKVRIGVVSLIALMLAFLAGMAAQSIAGPGINGVLANIVVSLVVVISIITIAFRMGWIRYD